MWMNAFKWVLSMWNIYSLFPCLKVCLHIAHYRCAFPYTKGTTGQTTYSITLFHGTKAVVLALWISRIHILPNKKWREAADTKYNGGFCVASFIKVTSSKSRKLLFVNGTLVNNLVNLLKTLLTKKLSKQLYDLPGLHVYCLEHRLLLNLITTHFNWKSMSN